MTFSSLTPKWSNKEMKSLAGGNSTILLCSSRKLGKWSNLITLYFSDGLVQPATRTFKSIFIWNTLQGTNISSFSRYFWRWCSFSSGRICFRIVITSSKFGCVCSSHLPGWPSQEAPDAEKYWSQGEKGQDEKRIANMNEFGWSMLVVYPPFKKLQIPWKSMVGK